MTLPAFPYVEDLTFPTAEPNPSDYNIVRAFPNLGFVRPIVWEVEELLGQEATLVIRDVDPAPNRFVGVDEIRFHDRR